jgi:hypothetical protein
LVEKPDESYGYLLWMDNVRNTSPGGYIQFLQGDARRWVQAGTIYGLAAAYVPGYVHVHWKTALGGYVNEWLPAAGVHSVTEENWHGLPLVE